MSGSFVLTIPGLEIRAFDQLTLHYHNDTETQMIIYQIVAVNCFSFRELQLNSDVFMQMCRSSQNPYFPHNEWGFVASPSAVLMMSQISQ